MKGRKGRKNKVRHVGQLAGADLSSGAQLACFLGIPMLRCLAAEDVNDLIDFMKFIAAESYADGFRAGWDSATEYNADVRQLMTLPPTTEH